MYTLKNGSVLKINQKCLTQSRLGTLDFNENKIIKIIRTLNILQAHGHDDIFIRMIQICDRTPLKPLIILFWHEDFGIKACSISSSLLVFLERFMTFLKTIYQVDFKGLF